MTILIIFHPVPVKFSFPIKILVISYSGPFWKPRLSQSFHSTSLDLGSYKDLTLCPLRERFPQSLSLEEVPQSGKCHESSASRVGVCKIRDGANIKSGSTLGIRLKPSDGICDLTMSREGKWRPQYFLRLMVWLLGCLLWVQSGLQNYMTGSLLRDLGKICFL